MADSLHYVTGIPDEIKFVIEEISTEKDVHDIIEQFEHTTSTISSVIDDVESQCEPELELDRSTNLHSIDVTKILTNNSEQSFIEDDYNTNKILELFNEINSPAEDKTESTNLESTDDQSRFRCRFCAEFFSIRSDYLSHIKKHRNKRFVSVSYDGKSCLHICSTEAAIDSTKQLFNCKYCNQKFTCRRHLATHNRTQCRKKPYICEQCQESFTRKKNFIKHVTAHRKLPKLYTCSICNKRFPSKCHLDKHMFVHSEGKPFVCKVCNKDFKVKRSFDCHMTKHSKENIIHTCNTCQKTFKTLFNLTRHERVHTGEKPYACSICDRSFSQPSGLQSHTLSHTGEKPYVCFVCWKGFTHRNYLKNHICVQMN